MRSDSTVLELREPMEFVFAAQYRQAVGIDVWTADCNSVFRAQVHARNIDYMQSLFGPLLAVVQLDRLLELTEIGEIPVSL